MIYLNKGKRGIVYLIREKGRDVVVKKERPGSVALCALENEARWLKTLNAYGIGPRFIRSSDGVIVMEYIKGEPFVEWYPKHRGKEGQHVVQEIFSQCRVMDTLGVNKLEMHHPVKHILIRKGKPVMIDFERCKRTLKPKNVTQLCQFLVKIGFTVDRETLETLLRVYKKTYDKKAFAEIMSLFVH